MVGQQTTALSESLRGVEAAIAAGQPDQALALCQDVQARFPRALPVQRVLGEVYLALRKPREALAALDRALSGNPEDARACCARALVHQIHGDSLAALAWYRRACDIAPDDQVLRSAYHELASHLGQPAYQPTRMGLARLYLRGDLYPHATREFEALLAEHPDSLEAQVGLAETLWRSRRAQEAAERCRRTLNNTPSCVKALLILAATEYDAGHADETQRLLRRVAELDPDQKLARVLFSDRIAAGDTAFTRMVLGDGSAAQLNRQTGALSGVLDPRLAGAASGSTGRLSAQTQGQATGTQPHPTGPLTTDGVAASAAGGARPAGLPADFRGIFAETEYMLWSREDDVSQTPTGAVPAFERSRVDPFARSSAFVPPVLREQGGALDDTEARAAINWIHWLQAQGARAREGLLGRPMTGPLTGPVPGATPPSAQPAATTPPVSPTPPVHPAPSPSGRLTSALPLPPAEQRSRPASGPLLPPTAPLPPATGPLHLGTGPLHSRTGPLPPATGPLPSPSSEALRAMFAQLEPDAPNPRVVEGELVSAVDAGDVPAGPDMPAVPANPDEIETARLDDGSAPPPSWSDSQTGAAGWITDEPPPESPAHLSEPALAASALAGMSDSQGDDGAGGRGEPVESDDLSKSGDSTPDVTLESLERSFADSGFSRYELRPGELAALSDSAAPDNGWHLADATERAPAVHFEQPDDAERANAAEPAVPFARAEQAASPEPAGFQAYAMYQPQQAADMDAVASPDADTAALVEPEPMPATDDYNGRLDLARRRRGDGRLDEALDEYRTILKNAPDLLDTVATELQESLSAAPDHPEVHRLLGDARIRQGDYLSALEAYNRAVALTQAQGS